MGDDELSPERAAHERCLAFARASAVGEVEGLFGPESLTWEIMREPSALLAAPSAVLLQLAHPAICDGVARFSSFAKDYRGRARRTFSTLYDLVFGSLPAALGVTRGLYAMHARIRGVVEEPGSPWHGRAYRANDQPLLLWVAVTLPVCTQALFEATVRPLAPSERARLYDEQRLAAAAVGVLPETMPPTHEAFAARYREILDGPDLHVGDRARGLLRVLLAGHDTAVVRAMSAAYLPERLREAYGLRFGIRERATLRAVIGALSVGSRVVPPALRATVAWHQAQHRVAAARGRRAPLLDRAVERAARRVPLPTSLSPVRTPR